jgi:hypothetical protein
MENIAKGVVQATALSKSTGSNTSNNEDDGLSPMDNLSNLSAQLGKLEVEYAVADLGKVKDARLAFVHALEQYRDSRYRLGERLAAYKKYYVAEQGWMEAARAVASAMGRDERTVRCIVDDFQRVSGVSAKAIKELERRGIDPAAPKNAPTITKLLMMPSSVVDSEPDTAVSTAIELARSKCDSRADNRRLQLTPNERQRLAVRTKVRSALAKVALLLKLKVLLAALEEEMFAEWGETAPVTATINPRALNQRKAVASTCSLNLDRQQIHGGIFTQRPRVSVLRCTGSYFANISAIYPTNLIPQRRLTLWIWTSTERTRTDAEHLLTPRTNRRPQI